METEIQAPDSTIQIGKARTISKVKNQFFQVNSNLSFSDWSRTIGIFHLFDRCCDDCGGNQKDRLWAIVHCRLKWSRYFLRALSVFLAIPRQHRNFNYLQMVATRLGGDAVSTFSFNVTFARRGNQSRPFSKGGFRFHTLSPPWWLII